MIIRLEKTTFGSRADEHRFRFRIEPDPLGDGIEVALFVPHVDGLEAQWDAAYSGLATTLERAAVEARRLSDKRQDRARGRAEPA